MMREPMDEGDVAQDYQARHNAAGVAASQKELGRQRAGVSLKLCTACGAKILQDRRDAVPGCTRCADCQTVVERMRRSGNV